MALPLSAIAQAYPTKPIKMIVPFIWTSSPSVPAKDLKELANLLKSNKSLQYNYGSTGQATKRAVACSLCRLGQSLQPG